MVIPDSGGKAAGPALALPLPWAIGLDLVRNTHPMQLPEPPSALKGYAACVVLLYWAAMGPPSGLCRLLN